MSVKHTQKTDKNGICVVVDVADKSKSTYLKAGSDTLLSQKKVHVDLNPNVRRKSSLSLRPGK